MANEDADSNITCTHSKEYLLSRRSAVCSSSINLGIRAEHITQDSRYVNTPKAVAKPVTIGPITACLDGVDPDVLQGRQGELRSIEEETDTRIQEEKRGVDTCSVVIAGTTANVEKAVLLVSQALLGDTSNFAAAVDTVLDDEPKPPLLDKQVLAETGNAKAPQVGAANSLAKSVTPPGRWRQKRLPVQEPDLELSPSDRENSIGPTELTLANEEETSTVRIDQAQLSEQHPSGDDQDAMMPESEADALNSGKHTSEQSPDDNETDLPKISSEKPGPMAFGPSPLLLMAFAKANESSQEAVRTAEDRDGIPSPKAALVNKKKKTSSEKKRAQQDKKAKEPVKFTFPKPGPIEGVKSRKKVILKVDKLSFAYRAKDKPVVSCSALTLSQVTRMVVAGAKASGKSTLAQLINGEQKPTEGTISKAAGLRMAYLSKLAIDDVLEHALDTPVQYIMRQVEEVGQSDKHALELLEKCGVDESSANHKQINQLSGSMKAQIALTLAMCKNPHILILDEPGQHFDRDGLNALSMGIKDYAGGVVILVQNKDKDLFNDVATEKWTLRGGQLCMESTVAESTSGGDAAHPKLEYKDTKSIKDRMGEIHQKLMEAKKTNTLSDEDMWKLFDELTKLKEYLKA